MEVKAVITKRDLKIFIHLPAKIHKKHINWLPPVYADERVFFNPQKNRSFGYSDTILALAWRNGVPAGRIMGIINKKYNEKKGEQHARFGYFECYNDPEISHALLSYVENWAREKGCSKIVGPYGFSDKDPQGFMVEGFEHPPLLAAACNEPYMNELLARESYGKEIDCLVYMYELSAGLPPVYDRIAERVQSSANLKVLEFTSRKSLRPYIIPFLKLMNDTYAELYGFVPMDEKEMTDFAKRYMPILDPRFIKGIEAGGKLAAFIVGIPSLTKGIQKSRGFLFPFGIFHIIRESRRARQLDLMLGAVAENQRGKGLEVLMSVRLLESLRKASFERIEIHLVLETNTRMLAELQRAGARQHKRFRVYGKVLA